MMILTTYDAILQEESHTSDTNVKLSLELYLTEKANYSQDRGWREQPKLLHLMLDHIPYLELSRIQQFVQNSEQPYRQRRLVFDQGHRRSQSRLDCWRREERQPKERGSENTQQCWEQKETPQAQSDDLTIISKFSRFQMQNKCQYSDDRIRLCQYTAYTNFYEFYLRLLLINFIKRFVMSDINAHFRNVHIQNLIEQNQDLRRRIAKLTEIQGYVELLVEKLDQAERRQRQIGSDNNLLRQQIRDLQLKFAQNQAMHGEQMRYVFTQHDQLLDQKNQALIQLKGINQIEKARATQLQSQLRVQIQESNQLQNEFKSQRQTVKQIDAQLKAQRIHQQQIISEYQSGMIQFRNKVSEMQQDLKILYQSLQQEKTLHTKTKDSWISQIGQFKAVLKEKQQQIVALDQHVKELEGAVLKMQDQNNLLNNYGKQMEIKYQKREEDNQLHLHNLQQNFRKREEENALQLRNLQQNFRNREEENKQAQLDLQATIDQLRVDLQVRKNQNLSLQALSNSQSKQLEELKLTLTHSKSDNDTYVTDNQRLIFLLQQSDRENVFLRDKVHQVQEYASIQIQKAKLDNLKLREENGVLSKNNNQRQTYLGTKLIQLKETVNARNTLQITLQETQAELSMLSEDYGQLHQQHGEQKQRNIQLQIQNKSLLEANNLVKRELSTIEDLNNRLQKQNLQIQTQNHNLTRLLSNPRELSKDYVDQIDKMLKNFHYDRQEQDKRHWLEKEKLKQTYEYEFKQKQMEFRRQISLLQQQINRIRKFQIMIERNARQTPSKTKR